MKTLNTIKLLLFVLILSACGGKESKNGKTEKKLETLSLQYQTAIRSVTYKNVAPFLMEASKSSCKSDYSQVSDDMRAEFVAIFKKQENKVKKVTIVDENNAEVDMCCSGFGTKFRVFWEMENEEWKVNYDKTIDYSLKNVN